MRLLASVFLVIVLWATPALAFGNLFGGGFENVSPADGVVTLDASGLEKGQSQHYRLKENGKTIRFFVVRDNQGTLRVALDACDVCWREDKGYINKDGGMVCVNCGQKFAYNRIGQVQGGCNPHPVAFTTAENTVTIQAQILLDGASYFPGNAQ